MKNLWAAFLVFLFATTALAQQQLSPPPAQPSAPVPAPMQKLAPDYSSEPFVVQRYLTKVRFENDGTGERDLTARIKVQSDAGVQQLGELVFGYNSANEEMVVKFVRVLKADGTVVTAAPDAIKEMTAGVERDAPEYTDYKEKHITVPSLHAGDTIEYDIVTKTVKALAPDEFWYSQDFLQDAIILDEQLEISVPQERALIVKSADYSNIDGSKPSTTSTSFSKKDADGRTIYLWKHSVLTRPTDDEQKSKKASLRKTNKRTFRSPPSRLGRRSLHGTPSYRKVAPRRRLRFAPRRKNSPRVKPRSSTKWPRSIITSRRTSAT